MTNSAEFLAGVILLKRILILLAILLTISLSLVGCGGVGTSPNDESLINAVLDSLAVGIVAENITQVMNCYADSITEINDSGMTTTFTKAAYQAIVTLAFAKLDYSQLSFTGRSISITGTTATVECTLNSTISGQVPESHDMIITLSKSTGTWLITVEHRLN